MYHHNTLLDECQILDAQLRRRCICPHEQELNEDSWYKAQKSNFGILLDILERNKSKCDREAEEVLKYIPDNVDNAEVKKF